MRAFLKASIAVLTLVLLVSSVSATPANQVANHKRRPRSSIRYSTVAAGTMAAGTVTVTGIELRGLRLRQALPLGLRLKSVHKKRKRRLSLSRKGRLFNCWMLNRPRLPSHWEEREATLSPKMRLKRPRSRHLEPLQTTPHPRGRTTGARAHLGNCTKDNRTGPLD